MNSFACAGDLLTHIQDSLRTGALEMGSIKRSVDIESREVRMRFAKISKASWAELYFDLYRQCFGENASEKSACKMLRSACRHYRQISLSDTFIEF